MADSPNLYPVRKAQQMMAGIQILPLGTLGCDRSVRQGHLPKTGSEWLIGGGRRAQRCSDWVSD